jgi:hypothetical protein
VSNERDAYQETANMETFPESKHFRKMPEVIIKREGAELLLETITPLTGPDPAATGEK